LIPYKGPSTLRQRRWLGAAEFTRQQALLRVGRTALLPRATLPATLATTFVTNLGATLPERRKSVRSLHKALPILR